MARPFAGSAAPFAAFMGVLGGKEEPARTAAAEAQRRTAGGGYFASRCKAPLEGAAENSRCPPLRRRIACRRTNPF